MYSRNKIYKHSRRLMIIMLVLALLLNGCNFFQGKTASDSFFAMDTVMTVELRGKNADAALEDIRDMIYTLDAKLTALWDDSAISELNSRKHLDISSENEEVAEIIRLAQHFSQLTDGAVDISTYAASRAWGIGSDNERVPDDEELRRLAESIDYRKIIIDDDSISIPDDMLVGLGAVAKGYAADRAIEIAKHYDISYAMINLGGNVACMGEPSDSKSCLIGIENPESAGAAIAAVTVNDKAVVSSGSYQRYFEKDGKRYHHIIDPKTAAPVETDISMVTVVCDSSAAADCLSTALYVMGEEGALDFWRRNRADLELIMVKPGKIIITEGLEDGFKNLNNMELQVVEY